MTFAYHAKHALKQLIHKVAPGMIAEANSETLSPLDRCFQNIKQLGFDPSHIVDIGGNRGGWSRVAMQYFPNSLFTIVEPQEHLKADATDLVRSANVRWHTAGIAKESGVLRFTLHDRDDSCSFRYSPEEAVASGWSQIEVPVYTLEDLLSQDDTPVPQIIKIDAEGLDLDVLEGAKSYLGQTDLLFVEAAVAQRAFPNTVARVVDAMNGHGYRLYDITDLNRTQKSRTLWLLELVFVRQGCELDTVVSTYES